MFVFSNTFAMLLSIKFNFVEKSVSSEVSSARKFSCTFIVCNPHSFASLVSFNCCLMLVSVELSSFFGLGLPAVFVGC